MTTTKIFGISRPRLTTDGEGVTTLVAFSGCPLRCKYCLNKTCWKPDTRRLYTPELLFEEVKIDQLYFLATHGGITLGGGERKLMEIGLISISSRIEKRRTFAAANAKEIPLRGMERVVHLLCGG